MGLKSPAKQGICQQKADILLSWGQFSFEFLKKKKRKRRGKGGGRKRRREEKGGERVPSLCPIHILPRILNARCIRELICLLAAIASEASKYGSQTSANYIAIPEG